MLTNSFNTNVRVQNKINYHRIEKAIKYLIEHYQSQPSLKELSNYVGVSEYHFQRMFTQWAGVSPKQFLSHLTVEALKETLHQSKDIIEASERVGLSAPSRAYDLMVNIEAVTPGEYKKKGKDLVIRYGFSITPFGECMVATTSRGVCAFQFVTEKRTPLIEQLKKDWNEAQFEPCDEVAEKVTQQIFTSTNGVLQVHLKGTPFQIKVWRALLDIPFSCVSTYSQVAAHAHMERATRAVASAIAKNPIAYIIPCHRVIRKEGAIGQYRWKAEKKASILAWEKTRER